MHGRMGEVGVSHMARSTVEDRLSVLLRGGWGWSGGQAVEEDRSPVLFLASLRTC